MRYKFKVSEDGKTMAVPKYGLSNYKGLTPKKRPGRHAKHYSKRIPHRKKSRGQG